MSPREPGGPPTPNDFPGSLYSNEPPAEDIEARREAEAEWEEGRESPTPTAEEVSAELHAEDPDEKTREELRAEGEREARAAEAEIYPETDETQGDS